MRSRSAAPGRARPRPVAPGRSSAKGAAPRAGTASGLTADRARADAARWRAICAGVCYELGSPGATSPRSAPPSQRCPKMHQVGSPGTKRRGTAVAELENPRGAWPPGAARLPRAPGGQRPGDSSQATRGSDAERRAARSRGPEGPRRCARPDLAFASLRRPRAITTDCCSRCRSRSTNCRWTTATRAYRKSSTRVWD